MERKYYKNTISMSSQAKYILILFFFLTLLSFIYIIYKKNCIHKKATAKQKEQGVDKGHECKASENKQTR